jgi:hypothetical protein
VHFLFSLPLHRVGLRIVRVEVSSGRRGVGPFYTCPERVENFLFGGDQTAGPEDVAAEHIRPRDSYCTDVPFMAQKSQVDLVLNPGLGALAGGSLAHRR